MALFVCEDVGTTKRKTFTATQRLRVFERHKGLCVLCGRRIEAGERWIVEHLRPLSLAGSNDAENLGPAHKDCADLKTHGPDGDLAQAAKAKRVKLRHIGAAAPKRPIQSAGFAKAEPQRRASTPLTKALPPRRGLYVTGA